MSGESREEFERDRFGTAGPTVRAERLTPSDAEIFHLACKLVDTASADRKLFWLPALSELCNAIRKQNAALSRESGASGASEQLALPDAVGAKFVIANGEMRFLAQAILRLDDVAGPAQAERDEALQLILAKCEQYWNEPNICDAEIHAVLEAIHRNARAAVSERDRLQERHTRLVTLVGKWFSENSMDSERHATELEDALKEPK